MKQFHKSCGSTAIVTRESWVGRRPVPMKFCTHCARLIEESEIHKTDRRISAITYKGRAFVYGRECK